MARKVLCIDDDLALVELCGALCKKMGLEFVTETNPHEALRLFTKEPEAFGAVRDDQLMPGMRGEELAKHLLQVCLDIPIILTTGNPEKEFVTETNPHEALRLFTKEPEAFGAVRDDQLMLGMRGEELAKHLLQVRLDIPIILTTGNP